MCGYLAATEKFTTVNNVNAPFIGPNPKRHALIVFVPSGNRLTLTHRTDAAINQGITIANSTSPFIMAREVFGDWICRQIQAIADVAGVTVGYVEVTDQDMKIPEQPGPNFQEQKVSYGYPQRTGSHTPGF